jgi:hypothetical protein
LGTKHQRNIVSTAHPIHSSLLLPYRAGNVTWIALGVVHANPPCGSELLPSLIQLCAMGVQSLRSMASAERWRQEDTNCTSSRLILMDLELLPLQLRHRWISTAFRFDISHAPCSDDSIGRRRSATRFVTRAANSI